VLGGKGLTDPVSMARFIGPECAGTSSLAVSRVVRLAEARPSKPSAPRSHREGRVRPTESRRPAHHDRP
jgi:hypothetical protein